MIQKTIFVIAVQNMQNSAPYYREVLGFSIREMGDGGWRMFERDGCRIMAENRMIVGTDEGCLDKVSTGMR